mmetsp:Transcript_8214/g.9901  ORF Transcript_8214/g.9901 Transcript_8214/m.9901 type:complete len:107 (-) Transcript_8214:132-452(-)
MRKNSSRGTPAFSSLSDICESSSLSLRFKTGEVFSIFEVTISCFIGLLWTIVEEIGGVTYDFESRIEFSFHWWTGSHGTGSGDSVSQGIESMGVVGADLLRGRSRC